MGGLLDFVKQSLSARVAKTITTTYTVLLTDQMINFIGTSAATVTLVDMATLPGNTFPSKPLLIENNGTAALTLAPATAVPAQTIGGRSSLVLQPYEWTLIEWRPGQTDWEVKFPNPLPAGLHNVIPLIATTSGTTSQNLCDSDGAVADGKIVAVVAIAQDTNAGNITVTNGTNTVCTIAKATTAGLAVCGVTFTYTNVEKGAILTCESSTTNGDAQVIVYFQCQQLNRQV